MRGLEPGIQAHGEARTRALLRERLNEIGEQLERLKSMRDPGVDALVGRVIKTLERERANLIAKIRRRN